MKISLALLLGLINYSSAKELCDRWQQDNPLDTERVHNVHLARCATTGFLKHTKIDFAPTQTNLVANGTFTLLS